MHHQPGHKRPDQPNFQLSLHPTPKNHHLWDSSRLLGLAEGFSARSENLVEVILEPPDLRVQAGKLPHAVDLLVPVGVGAVSMSLDGDLGAGCIGVPLVRHAKLVVANDLVIRDLLPLGAADEVLGLEERITEHVWVGNHGNEFLSRHRLPDLVEEGTVVDLYGAQLSAGEGALWGSKETLTLKVGAMHLRRRSQS